MAEAERSCQAALCLGPGGHLAFAYQVGAVIALEELTNIHFDIYNGTSAGALVALPLALGFVPKELLGIIGAVPSGTSGYRIRPIKMGELFKPNFTDIAKMPLRLAKRLFSRKKADNGENLLDKLFQGIPSGLFSGAGIESYIHELLTENSFSDSFDSARKKGSTLNIFAADIDTGERVNFNSPEWQGVSLSKAARASSAMPFFFAPAEINNQYFIDGGLTGVYNLNQAEAADLFICINPIVPLNNRNQPVLSDSIANLGSYYGMNQAYRLLIYQKKTKGVALFKARHPDKTIIEIEPTRKELLLFKYDPFSYSLMWEKIVRVGYLDVMKQFEGNRENYSTRLDRFGIQIRNIQQEKIKELKQAGSDRILAILAR